MSDAPDGSAGGEQVAAHLANARPGYELVDYAPVGLPFWRAQARVIALVRKPMQTIDEFVLRAVAAGVTVPDDIAGLLGIDDVVLDVLALDLVDRGYLRLDAGGSETETQFALRELGESTLSQLAEFGPEEKVIWVNFDGLLRRPVGYMGEWYEPRDMREAGLREIPAVPARGPNAEELRADLPQINRLLGQTLGYREKLEDVLAIKLVERRFRVYRPAVALVYRSIADGDIQVALALDGEASTPHERAFAAADLAKKFGVGRNGIPVSNELLASDQPALVTRAARSKLAGGRPGHEPKSVAKSDAAVRAVQTYEHPQHLRQGLREATKRLLIVSPWMKDRVVGRQFLTDLEEALDRGVDVFIGWGFEKADKTDRDADKRALERLQRLAREYAHLRLKRIGGTHAKVLVCDERLIITSFNWLSFLGDPKRSFRDERGLLVDDPATVEGEFERYRALIADEG